MYYHYDKEGNKLPGAKPWDIPVTDLSALRGHLVMSPQSAEQLEVFLEDSRKWIRRNCK